MHANVPITQKPTIAHSTVFHLGGSALEYPPKDQVPPPQILETDNNIL